MTLVSEIIQRAYRETNIIPLVATPTTAQSTEALPLLNTIILSTLGNETGDELTDLNYGGDFDQSSWINQWIPDNTRLVLNLSAAAELDATPYPYEGQRLAFVDAASNLTTFNLVINGNGRNIEGAPSVTLDTDDDTRQWMYRADTGNWVKITSLVAGDNMPFPVDFDDYFIIMLAMRLNPRYGQELNSQSLQTLNRTRGQIRSRYRGKNKHVMSEPALVLLPSNDYARYYFNDDYFSTGNLFGW